MLAEQTLEKLTAMRLHGMAKALRDWLDQPKDKNLAPADLVAMLADAEWLHRERRSLDVRLRNAKLKIPACLEDITYEADRGLVKAVVQDLASSRWITNHQNIIVTGRTGVGKSYLACALAQKACRDGFTAIYKRTSRLFDELAQARGDGSHPTLMRRLAKAQVLVLDDFGMEPLTATQRKELLEVMDDRYRLGSTIVTSQLEPGDWHPVIGDPTVADAICDRLVHNAHKVKMGGESIRKSQGLTDGPKGKK
jgi:DNA replication protein DnaC